LKAVAERVSGLLDVYLEKWRKVYYKEIEQGPSRVEAVKDPPIQCFMVSDRPFFAEINYEDPLYVNIFRSIEYSALKYNLPSKIVVMRISGYRLGVDLVKGGLIKSLDDVPIVLAMYKIGLTDIVKESTNLMSINIYECISCYGLPNLNKTMCDFEAGVLQGILSCLYGSNIVKERYCWGLGFSFCGFDVIFE